MPTLYPADNFYCLCPTVYFPVSIFQWDPSNFIFISEIDLWFFSNILLKFWQLMSHHLLPSCHPFQNYFFCIIVFLHRNDCFIEFYKLLWNTWLQFSLASQEHFPGNILYLGVIFRDTFDILHRNTFAFVLPILSTSFLLLIIVWSGLSWTSSLQEVPAGQEVGDLHYFNSALAVRRSNGCWQVQGDFLALKML